MTFEQPNYPAVVVQRVDEHRSPDTTELRELTQATGCTIVGELTQEREADPEFEIGSGKVEELTQLVKETNATNVIFDGRLSPFQMYNLGCELPDGVDIIDRFLLVLRALDHTADSHREQLQVELGSRRYELPRIDAKLTLSKRDTQPGFMGLNHYDESTEKDVKDRISALKDELSHFETTNKSRRDGHKQDGFDMVAFAGYTNSGKSTLFKRLADDLTVNPDHRQDIDTTVTTASTPLTTFEPTTRRMPHERRDILLTDTLGLVSDIPYWIYDSLAPSLNPIYEASLVVVTADITEPTRTIREKLATVQDFLRAETDAPTMTVFTKADAASESEIEKKLNALGGIAPNAVVTSAHENTGIKDLKQKLDTRLPALVEERLQLPLTDDTMPIVSWIHDNAHVTNEDYSSDSVFLEFEGNRAVVKQARAKATTLAQPRPADD